MRGQHLFCITGLYSFFFTFQDTSHLPSQNLGRELEAMWIQQHDRHSY